MLTKNIQSRAALEKLVEQAFPNKAFRHIQELTEGFFNIAYLVAFKDGTEFVLKIAPHPDTTIMTYEKDIMATEVASMKLVAEQTSIPLPKVQVSDFSCTLCNAPYFFMERISGNSLSSLKEQLQPAELSSIYAQTGKINRQINELTNIYFGLPGQPSLQGDDWYGVFFAMMRALVQDTKKSGIEISISLEELLALLQEDKSIFTEVKRPSLVHWDIWDGNIFIENGKITGLIDWERCLWGDFLMEVGFRSYSQSADFLNGYGKTHFTVAEKRRIYYYDIYLLIIAAQEHVYRGYEADNGWAITLMKEKLNELKSR
ncbi:phosphotransferase family protein [Scatolibacter rhodanostii]|uniref:phosphotransferase family protein n=1 Tax=Scatolibacter rhodanostii TaxID=2014781 RepID=UPI000C0736D5|nr:phosphotransferase [Scatolibacter rhodanostii]